MLRALAIFGLLLIPVGVAAAERTVSSLERGGIQLLEYAETGLELGLPKEASDPILKTLKDRFSVDMDEGLRFNLLELERGIDPDIQIYLEGPYEDEKPGIWLKIRF